MTPHHAGLVQSLRARRAHEIEWQHFQERDTLVARDEGRIVAYIMKPVQIDEVLGAIRKAVG